MEKVDLGAFLALIVEEAAPHSLPGPDLNDAVLGADGNLYRYVDRSFPSEHDGEYTLLLDQQNDKAPRILLDDCQAIALRVLREQDKPWGKVWMAHRVYGVTLDELVKKLKSYRHVSIRKRIKQIDDAILSSFPPDVVESVRQATCTEETHDVRDDLT